MKKDNTIRIAMIIGKWLGGGVEAVIMNYYRHIDRSKIQFDFICDDDSTDIPYEEIKKLGGRVILVPKYEHLFKYIKKLKKVFRDGNYKIVHSNINALSVFPLYAAKKAGVPVRIAHSHSTSNKKEWKKTLVKNVLRPFSKMYATDYFACSEYAGRWLFGNKIFDQGKVTIINNAIDLDKFKYDEKLRNKKRKELGIKDNTLVIGHIGRFVAQKNHTFLVDIFNEMHKKEKNTMLLLIGQGPKVEEIKQKVKDLGLTSAVKFLAKTNDVHELYQAFDLFLLPSLYEGLPVVGVEAQATGNLCYLSDNMTKETKVLDSTVFMSLSNTPEEWADNILKDIKKYKKRDTKKEVSKYGFDIEKEANKLESFYKGILLKKVVFVLPDFSIGGAEKMVSLVASNIDNSKYIPYILLLKKHNHSYFEKEIKDTVCTIFLNKKSGLRLKTFIKAYKELKKIKPSIIHTNLHAFLYILPYALVKKVKIIHTIHCEPNRDGSKMHRIILKFLIHKKAIIPIAISDQLGIQAKKYYKIKSCDVIYNPVDTRKFKCDYTRRSDDGKVNFVCVGRLVEEKNHKFLIQGFIELHRMYKNIFLNIIGDGPLKDMLENMILKNNAGSYINLLGSKENINDFLNKSDIFVLTSLTEGMPMTVLEAMSCGKAILSSNVGGVCDVVTDNGLLFESNNIDSFIKNASVFLDNPKIISTMGERSLKTAVKYDITNIVNQYMNLYDEYYKR